jgi:hypothetical protein
VTLRIEASGAQLITSSGQAEISLYSGQSFVAQNVFAYSVIDSQIQFSSPDQVNAWINSFDSVDGFDVTCSAVQVRSGNGQNTVAVSPVAMGIALGGASSSWRFSGGGEFSQTGPGNM